MKSPYAVFAPAPALGSVVEFLGNIGEAVEVMPRSCFNPDGRVIAEMADGSRFACPFRLAEIRFAALPAVEEVETTPGLWYHEDADGEALFSPRDIWADDAAPQEVA